MNEISYFIQSIEMLHPMFIEYRTSKDCHFDSASIHGYMASFSHFIDEQYSENVNWSTLALLLNDTSETDDVELLNSLYTCFIENIARPNHPIYIYLNKKLRGYFDL